MSESMELETLLYNLREEVSCPLCSDLFKDPRQLPCLHSFCLHCLQHWRQASGGRDALRCPKCQSLNRVPASGDLKDLPVSFYLNGLIDVLAIKECSKTQLTCGNCDKKSSKASYCFQCCIFFCEHCTTAHNIMKLNKHHRVLPVEEFQEEDYEDVLKRPAFCSEPRHEKEELKFFCKDCATPVCQVCCMLGHSRHVLELIEDEVERERTEMRDMIKAQRHNLQAKTNIVGQLNEGIEKLMQQCSDVKRHVQMFIDRLITVLETKKQTILEAVENQTRQLVQNRTTEKIKIENEIKVIATSLEVAEKLLTRSGNVDILQLHVKLETIFAGTVQENPATHDPLSLPVLVFEQNQPLLDTVTSEEIGSLELLHPTKASQSIAEGKGLTEAVAKCDAEFILTTKNAEGRQCYNKQDQVTVEIQDKQRRECVTEVQITDNKNGKYQISYHPRDQGRYSITIKVNGLHICGSPYDLAVKTHKQAVSSGNLSVQGKSRSGNSPSSSASCYFSWDKGAYTQAIPLKQFHFKPVSTFGGPGWSEGTFHYPWGVAVSDTGEIAVTDQQNHRVQIFDSSGKYLRSFGCKGTNQGEFNDPSGICFDIYGNVFIADKGNHTVQIFTREGRSKGMFGGKGSLDSQLSHPLGLSSDANGDIIVADSSNKLIKIFTTNGKFVRKIGEPGSFSCPVHCVQCDEYFIVSDEVDQCIKVFSREGKFQYKFGQKGSGDGEFNNPQCLSVTKWKHLMVGDRNNDRIQIFELNGKFVGKFGTKGSNLGELYCPTSVAGLHYGIIVVCDYFNHRIQIFE